MSTRTVAVTGATGFVGRHVVRELLAQGYAVRALARDARKARETIGGDPRVQIVVGNILDAGVCEELVAGCSACIHLVGIIREAPGGQTFRRMHVEATRAIVKACESKGVKRYVHMSALGVRDTGKAEYQKTKWEAERLVRDSMLLWTILRPGMIHGVGSEFLAMAKGFASGLEAPFVFLPYFTRGQEDKRVPLGGVDPTDPVVAPVFVEDVASAFVRAIAREQTIGETYNLAGPEALPWPKVLTIIRDGTGGNHLLKPWGVPASLAAIGATMAQKIGMGGMLPFDAGMAIMASEDSVAELDKVKAHLDLSPRPFTRTFQGYAAAI